MVLKKPDFLQPDAPFVGRVKVRIGDGDECVLANMVLRHCHNTGAVPAHDEQVQSNAPPRPLWIDMSCVSNDAWWSFHDWLAAHGYETEWFAPFHDANEITPAGPESTTETLASAEEEIMAENVTNRRPDVAVQWLEDGCDSVPATIEAVRQGGNILFRLESETVPEAGSTIMVAVGSEVADAQITTVDANTFGVAFDERRVSKAFHDVLVSLFAAAAYLPWETPAAEDGTDPSAKVLSVVRASSPPPYSEEGPWPDQRDAEHTMFGEPNAEPDAIRASAAPDVGPTFDAAFVDESDRLLGDEQLVVVGPARESSMSTASGSFGDPALEEPVTEHGPGANGADGMSRRSQPLRPVTPSSVSGPVLPPFSRRPPTPPPTPADSEPAIPVSDDIVVMPTLACLLVVSVGDTLVNRAWFSDEVITIGRAEGSMLRLPEHPVSRNHARIVHKDSGDGFLLEDVGSSEGTWVDGGAKLERPWALSSGNEISIGQYTIEFVGPYRLASVEVAFPGEAQDRCITVAGDYIVVTEDVPESCMVRFPDGSSFAMESVDVGDYRALFLKNEGDEMAVGQLEAAIKSLGFDRYSYTLKKHALTSAESNNGSARGSSGAEEEGESMSDNDTRQIPMGTDPRAPETRNSFNPAAMRWLPRIVIVIAALLAYWLFSSLATALLVAVAGIFHKEILKAARQNKEVSDFLDVQHRRALRVWNGVRAWTWPLIKWGFIYVPVFLIGFWMVSIGVIGAFSMETAGHIRNGAIDVVSSGASWVGDGVSSLGTKVYDKVAGADEEPTKIEATAAVDHNNLPIEEVPANNAAAAAAPAQKPAKKVALPDKPANPSQCFSGTATQVEKEACCERLEVGDDWKKILDCKKAVSE